MSVMMVQIKCQLNNAELFVEIENKAYYEEIRELELKTASFQTCFSTALIL